MKGLYRIVNNKQYGIQLRESIKLCLGVSLIHFLSWIPYWNLRFIGFVCDITWYSACIVSLQDDQAGLLMLDRKRFFLATLNSSNLAPDSISWRIDNNHSSQYVSSKSLGRRKSLDVLSIVWLYLYMRTFPT